MQDESVLVEVWVPAAYLKRDMYLPMDMPIDFVLSLLDKMLKILESNFVIQKDTRLYRMDPFAEMLLHATLRDYQIKNAETLILL